MIGQANVVAEHCIADGALLLLAGHAHQAAVVAAVVQAHLLGHAARLLLFVIWKREESGWVSLALATVS